MKKTSGAAFRPASQGILGIQLCHIMGSRLYKAIPARNIISSNRHILSPADEMWSSCGVPHLIRPHTQTTSHRSAHTGLDDMWARPRHQTPPLHWLIYCRALSCSALHRYNIILMTLLNNTALQSTQHYVLFKHLISSPQTPSPSCFNISLFVKLNCTPLRT